MIRELPLEGRVLCRCVCTIGDVELVYFLVLIIANNQISEIRNLSQLSTLNSLNLSIFYINIYRL